MSDDDDYDFTRSRSNRGNRGRGSQRGTPNLRDSIQEIKSGFQSGVILLALAAVAFLSYTSFYRVDASDQGIVLRFGKHVRTVEPGLQLKLPWPVESVYTVPVRRVQTEEVWISHGLGWQGNSVRRKEPCDERSRRHAHR